MPCAVTDAPGWGSISIPVTVAALLIALIYWRGWSRLRGASPNAPSVRALTTFLGGILALWFAVGSPFATLDHARLTFHMLQHLVLMTIAAPLILLAGPVRVLRHGLPDRPGCFGFCPSLRPPRPGGNILFHPI